MRKIRKIMASILSSAMLLGTVTAIGSLSAPVAQAAGTGTGAVASYTDVTSATPHYVAIMGLDAIGVAVGNGDGTYTPAAPITRAQMAKEVDVAMGYGAAASSSSGNCAAFNDICPGGQPQWYTGYAAVASAQSLLNGVGNGAFDPNGQVTYAQVVTVAVRMLGFASAVQGGVWPANYMAEANQLQLLKNVTIADASAAAPRQDVAQLLYDTLASNMAVVTYQSNGVSTVSQCNTGNNLNNCVKLLTNTTSYTITKAPSNADTSVVDTVYVNAGSTTQLNIDGANTVVASTGAILAGASNLNGLLGTQVDYITDNNGQAIFAGVVSTTATVTYQSDPSLPWTPSSAYLASYIKGANTSINGKMLVSTSGGANVTVQNAAANVVEVGATPPSNSNPITVNTDKAGNIVGVVSGTSNGTMAVITSVGSSSVSYVLTGGTASTSATVASNATITLDGASATLSGLKANDLVYVTTSGGQVIALVAYDKSSTVVATGYTTSGGSNWKNLATVNYGSAKSLTVDPTNDQLVNQGGSFVATGGAISGLTNSSVTAYYEADGATVGYLLVTTQSQPVGILQVGSSLSVAGWAGTLPLDVNGTVTNLPLATGFSLYDGIYLDSAGNVTAAPGNVSSGNTNVQFNTYNSVNAGAITAKTANAVYANGGVPNVSGNTVGLSTPATVTATGLVAQAYLNSSGNATKVALLPYENGTIQSISGSTVSVKESVYGSTYTYSLPASVQVFTSTAEAQTVGSISSLAVNQTVNLYYGQVGSVGGGVVAVEIISGSGTTTQFGVLTTNVSTSTTGSSNTYSATIEVTTGHGDGSTTTNSYSGNALNVLSLAQGDVVVFQPSGTSVGNAADLADNSVGTQVGNVTTLLVPSTSNVIYSVYQSTGGGVTISNGQLTILGTSGAYTLDPNVIVYDTTSNIVGSTADLGSVSTGPTFSFVYQPDSSENTAGIIEVILVNK